MASAVFEAGIEAIEVPLNSPDPFTSIERIVSALPSSHCSAPARCLTAEQVDRLAGAGGRLLVSPNIDADVMHRAAHHGLGHHARRVHPQRSLPGAAPRRIGAEVLSGQRARAERHRRHHGGAAGRCGSRRGRRRLGQGFRRLCEDRRAHIRPRLQPVCARHERGGCARARRDRGQRLARRLRSRPPMAEPAVSIFSDVACELGEGPSYDPGSGKLFWFDIVGRKLLGEGIPGRRHRRARPALHGERHRGRRRRPPIDRRREWIAHSRRQRPAR